jgi:RNA polymerase sigma-70 factor (ECF subfamily)
MAQWDPGRYRELLQVMARRLQLDPRLKRRFDSSDLVQETLLKAYQTQKQFCGQTEGERIKWLYQIFANTARDKIREAYADKRDLNLERSVDAIVSDSSVRMEAWLAAVQSSPSQKVERQELLLQVSEALNRLPADQGDAIIRHHLMGERVSEIARHMGCTKKAVAGLLYRGLKQLREILDVGSRS